MSTIKFKVINIESNISEEIQKFIDSFNGPIRLLSTTPISNLNKTTQIIIWYEYKD